MTLKRLVLPALLFLSLAAFLTRDLAPKTPLAATAEMAYYRAEWGMSPEAVASANAAVLKEKPLGPRFYQAAPGSEARYQSLEAQGRFLGRDAVISYTFYDGKLVSYHIFISDSDGDALDADMKRYLLRTFGPNSEVAQEDAALKMVWQTKDKIVNYWFYEEPNALSRPYRAGFGVQHRAD